MGGKLRKSAEIQRAWGVGKALSVNSEFPFMSLATPSERDGNGSRRAVVSDSMTPQVDEVEAEDPLGGVR
jgi:hypothetical protein